MGVGTDRGMCCVWVERGQVVLVRVVGEMAMTTTGGWMDWCVSRWRSTARTLGSDNRVDVILLLFGVSVRVVLFLFEVLMGWYQVWSSNIIDNL